MKKLITLLTILLMSLTAFSQTGTDSIPVKTFPIPVVRLIAKDLLVGDSARALLSITEAQVKMTEQKVALKDSVINTMKIEEIKSRVIINAGNEKYNTLNAYTQQVEKDLKKEKVKNKFKSILSTGIIGVLTYLLITK